MLRAVAFGEWINHRNFERRRYLELDEWMTAYGLGDPETGNLNDEIAEARAAYERTFGKPLPAPPSTKGAQP